MQASTVDAELVMRFPGPNHDLLLTCGSAALLCVLHG